MGLPALVELSAEDTKYQEIENQFTERWLHPTYCPDIFHIYEIHPQKILDCGYRMYRQLIEWKGDFESQGLPKGNERRRFHGTKRACNLGDYGSTTLCNLSRCSLCSIIRQSYKLRLAGTNKHWNNKATGRFGHGIYTSATSSKADDYSENLDSSTFKAMLLNRVVVGEGKKLCNNHSYLTEPPEGFDSVIGEPTTSGQSSVLNYDELVVYNECAIIPAYLIVYCSDD